MSRKVAHAAVPEQAKRIRGASSNQGSLSTDSPRGSLGGPPKSTISPRESTTSPQDFRPFPTAAQEAGESLARALRVSKAEAIGERLSLSRSRVYELAADPSQIPVGLLLDLARLDPDPAALSRIAHALLVAQAALAAERKAAGEISVRFRPSPSSEQGRLFE